METSLRPIISYTVQRSRLWPAGISQFQIYIDNVLKHEYINTMPQDWDNIELVLGFQSNQDSVAVAEFKNFVFKGSGK